MRHTRQATADEAGGDADTRLRILDAAVACFTQYGNEKTTLNDVARVAGLARQTIYRYFPDRRALLEAVKDQEDELLRAQVAVLAEQSTSLEDFLAALVAARMTTVGRYRTRQHLLEHDRGLMQSLFLSREDTVTLYRQLVAPQLVAARRRGELASGVVIDEAAEWIAISLSSLTTLTTAATFDLDDATAVGRFYARHLCQGLVRTTTPARRR